VIIGFLSPFANMPLVQQYVSKNITSLAMELIPRITKAQKMDALSSQNNLAGYRAVIEACYYSNKIMPMLMTSAGSIQPSRVLVIGAGVAGLQAIATSKRLGAITTAYDIRPSSKEQVESVGGRFIDIEGISSESANGYAKELTQDSQQRILQILTPHVIKSDIIISTAQIPGKQAPRMITKEMIGQMKPNSIIVDMATSTGGNVEGSVKDDVCNINGVTILGHSNFSSHIPHESSKLYANNLYNLVIHAFKNGKLDVNDDIVSAMLITHHSKLI
jgi:NAD(P) transhydrogenase subunit alpha